ncbi:MAG: biotin carboxylase, partial [Lentisphaerae bacterium]|nr:biotin carboxylase [Lentisphaerota bacterium]
MEEFVQGEEYSCDFIIDGDRLQIVRIARKVPLRNTCFGTTLAYQLCPQLPEPLNLTDFHSQLWEAANVMGLDRAICMLDFIVTDKDAVMIEMTPRPGGDCIPPLLKQSAGFDMLSFAVRFAEGKQGEVPELSEWKPYVGLRLLTAKEGVVERFNTDALRYDQRVLNYHLKHNSGHTVVLPPNDYDSRVLGYVIFDPSRSGRIEPECLEIADLLRIEWKEF